MTDEEKKELVQDVLNSIKTDSQSVDELEQVTSLDNVKSLPAMQGEKLVTAPISLLSKPATDAAATAKAAAEKANAAATAADTATTATNEAIEKATAATTAANTAASEAKAEAANISQYDTRIEMAMNGATARFDGFVEDVTIEQLSYMSIDGVYYDTVKKTFCGKSGTNYCNNWADGENTDAAAMYLDDSRSAPLKDKAYVCDGVLYVWSDEEGTLVEISGSGGGNTYNVTEQVPLDDGYYTLATAIKAVEEKQRAKGRCVTYESAQGKWVTKQFIGTSLDSWEQEASWEDFGGAGTVKSITVNGQKQTPDSTGNVSVTVKETEVDESLDASSTNPVQNSAVTAKLNEVEANTIFGANAELSEDESTVRLTMTNKSGAEVVAVDLPAGSGGSGGGDASTTKIVLGASMDNVIIKEGGSARLTYTYDHQYSSGDEKGESTGQKATISVEMKRGSTLMYSDTLSDVSKGSYTLDLTNYLMVGTTDIYVRATTTDPTTGKTQTKQSYVSVKVVTLSSVDGLRCSIRRFFQLC